MTPKDYGAEITDSMTMSACVIGINYPGSFQNHCLDWQKKTSLEWLMSVSWNRTDGLKSFHSSSEYADELLRECSMVTFYWGSGAV